jgi:hypothetical protein
MKSDPWAKVALAYSIDPRAKPRFQVGANDFLITFHSESFEVAQLDAPNVSDGFSYFIAHMKLHVSIETGSRVQLHRTGDGSIVIAEVLFSKASKLIVRTREPLEKCKEKFNLKW